MSTHFKFAIGALLVAAAFVPISAQKPTSEAKQKNAVEPQRVEKSGWIQLFNGKDLTGWRGYNKPDAKETRWKVVDGLLALDHNGAGDTHGQRDLITDATYEQFDLRWEWKISEGGNSGVKYFVVEDRPDAIGHEYQMIDDLHEEDGARGPKYVTGSVYDVVGATNVVVKPLSEFNQSRLIVQVKHVEHWHNGKLVLTWRATP